MDQTPEEYGELHTQLGRDVNEGKITLNAARAQLGLRPYSFPEADMLQVWGTAGIPDD
jgi:hypothetical protein